MRKFRVTVTEHQLRLIANCIEDCCRFMAGQTELYNSTCLLDNGKEVREKLDELHELVVPELHKKYGKFSSYAWNGGQCPNEYQRKFLAESYYLYREMLHYILKDAPTDNCYKSETLRCADSGEPIKIEIF